MALWGGRFSSGPAESVFALSRSVHFDYRLAPYDLRSSLAHLSVLQSSGLIEKNDAEKIAKCLREIMVEVADGSFAIAEGDEDIHSALERSMMERIGEVGGKLRAGRSRNDQVATDLRLFAIDHLLQIADSITQLQSALLAKAKEYADDIYKRLEVDYESYMTDEVFEEIIYITGWRFDDAGKLTQE